MTTRTAPGRRHRGRNRGPATRRGIASVLSMMFLILFGSLAAAMAIASKANIQTAATHRHVTRAMGAAETGLALGSQRLQEAAARFLISNSDMSASYTRMLWAGTLPGSELVTVLPPRDFSMESPPPAGIIQALASVHARDGNIAASVSVSAPTIAGAMSGVSTSTYATTNWLFTPAVGLDRVTPDDPTPPVCFTIVYAPLANGTDVRVISTGYDYDYGREGKPITRTIMQDFRMTKRVRQAVISPTKIMIGKNVLVSGDLGARFTDVDTPKGDPVVIRSDFYGLDDTLDDNLDLLFAGMAYDVDGDNRLRTRHPTESLGIPDFDGVGGPDGTGADRTADGFVDDFDVFLIRFDTSPKDGKVVLSSALTDGTPAEGLTPEFVRPDGTSVDDDLALLIDMNMPDRNRNGIYGFNDVNGDGLWQDGEAFLDRDVPRNLNRDQILGYRDGMLDRRDQYAKVGGKLSFKTTQAAWIAGQGDYKPRLRGPVRPSTSGQPVAFAVSDSSLPAISPDSFVSSEAELKAIAEPKFWDQVAINRGISVSALAGFVETLPPGSTSPRYLRLDGDANYDGMPDNWNSVTSEQWEKMPFNSPAHSDWYYRPVFENMEFKNVIIPRGLNALFRNCTFAGVTYIETYPGNTHVLWSEYGKLAMGPDDRPILAIPRSRYLGPNYPTAIPSTAYNPDGSVLLAEPAIDEGDVRSDREPIEPGWRDLLPSPLLIDGKRITDTRTFSNNIRFHDCIFVGSVVSEKPTVYTHQRNKLQFTGATRFTLSHPTRPTDPKVNPDSEDLPAIQKSQMLLPQYSVDLGAFNSPASQNVRLTGAVIAGVLDVRGNASIDGALLLTFAPRSGEAPLIDALGNPIGTPAAFNTSIGYFGPEDGDTESLDPETLPIHSSGKRIVGYDTSSPPDGIADEGPDYTGGGEPVFFNGYGRVTLRFNPNMVMPNGVMLPATIDPLPSTYREGKP